MGDSSSDDGEDAATVTTTAARVSRSDLGDSDSSSSSPPTSPAPVNARQKRPLLVVSSSSPSSSSAEDSEPEVPRKRRRFDRDCSPGWSRASSSPPPSALERHNSPESTLIGYVGSGGSDGDGDSDWSSVAASTVGSTPDDDDWGSIAEASDVDGSVSAANSDGGEEVGEVAGDTGDGLVQEEDTETEDDGVGPAMDGEAEGSDADDWGRVAASSGDEEDELGGIILVPATAEEQVSESDSEHIPSPARPSGGAHTKRLASATPAADGVPAKQPRFILSAYSHYQNQRQTPMTVKHEYVHLLNGDIGDAAGRNIYSSSSSSSSAECPPPKPGSYVGASYWTGSEKDTFFDLLAVLGKGRADAIARGIQTKSVLECQAHIAMLDKGSSATRAWVRYRSRDTVGLGKIPAAVEVSTRCIEALDHQALLLREALKKADDEEEKRRWGGIFWLVDYGLAARIDEYYQAGDLESVHSIALEAELLNVGNMIKLSERLFMNGQGDQNYRSICENEEPSMHYSALTEFYELVIALTRRLVQTAIFMADSRLRCVGGGGASRHVRRDDAEAAVDALNLARDSWAYWARVPRRHGFAMVATLHDAERRRPERLDPDYVEKWLARRRSRRDRNEFAAKYVEPLLTAVRQRNGESDEDSPLEQDEPGQEATMRDEPHEGEGNVMDERHKGEGDVVDEGDVGDSCLDSGSDVSRSNDHVDDVDVCSDADSKPFVRHQIEMQEANDATEDEYLESLDRKLALKAERGLWWALGYAAEDLGDKEDENEDEDKNEGEEGEEGKEDGENEEGDDELPKAPPVQGRYLPATINWRDMVRYRAPWEVMKRPRPEEEKGGGETAGSGGVEKRRKVERETAAGSANGSPMVRALARPPPPPPPSLAARPARSPRKQRSRRQSTVPPGYVSTVEAVSDAEPLYSEEEESGGDMYQQDEDL